MADTELTTADIHGGKFKTAPCFEYGCFMGYDLIFIDAKGMEKTVAHNLEPVFATYLMDVMDLIKNKKE